MRISSVHIYDIANRGMSDLNQALVKTQEQIASGKRVLSPADDPVASTKIMQLNEELANSKQYTSNIDIARNSLALSESSLESVGALIQRIQELAISAGNTASLSKNEYTALATEVESRLGELMNLANTKNANGDFIFAGYKSRQQPFTGDVLSGFRYNGDEGQQYIKVANNTLVPATDSGKAIFADVDSAKNTISTYVSPSNQSDPPLAISVGRVVDQAIYDAFYPEDIVISFNADGNIVPPGKNFTATAKSTGRVLLANQAYSPGQEIAVAGVAVKISGNPVSGTQATPASRVFGSQSPTAGHDFSAAPETFRIRVGGLTQTFVLDAAINNTADLAAVLNSASNGNAARLAALGMRADAQGLFMDAGANFTVMNGSAAIDTVMGLSSNLGSTSTNGQLAKAGDKAFVDSAKRQDILTTLARLSETMRAFDGSPTSKRNISAVVADTLNNLNAAQTSVLNVVSKIGARVNTLDSTKSLQLDIQVVSEKILSNISNLDYAEAATRLSQESMVLEATQQSFIRVSQLNLFSKL
jgi:flagellar hook-associated protein 3 FlgL